MNLITLNWKKCYQQNFLNLRKWNQYKRAQKASMKFNRTWITISLRIQQFVFLSWIDSWSCVCDATIDWFQRKKWKNNFDLFFIQISSNGCNRNIYSPMKLSFYEHLDYKINQISSVFIFFKLKKLIIVLND